MSDNNLFEEAPASVSASDLHASFSQPCSDWIISCKLFFPLLRRYWEESKIPKVILTETNLKGVYGYALELEKLRLRAPGVLHLSYVWENGAHEAIAKSDDCNFTQKCLDELDEMLLCDADIGEIISPFVDRSQAPAIHWVRKPNSPAYAKLYREVYWNPSSISRSRPLATPSSPFVL